MERYLCIHGHFYQPPRENPSLEAIELQESAYPYHDWNERITAECYTPNALSRMLDGKGQILQMVNNYSKISFNFGPTLLSWMKLNAPDTYGAILEADRESQKAFSGHGSALAQAYNHLILPLANRRDKYTQVWWGIRDFEHRFRRQPEGMWLSETAVDLETLEVLAELGVRFTILAPHQVRRVRRIGSRAWQDVSGSRIDTTRAYLQRLPSGRTINLFFYEGSISRAVAFQRLLNNGAEFAHRLLGAFSKDRSWPQLLHIATDGETYGHHHRFGEMALAYALHYIESNNLARLTNYGEYLERHPPAYQVEIIGNTSWSCAHGVERWRSDCGCQGGGHSGWNQAWRAPLRQALDWLRDTLAPAYQERGKVFLKDPWAARDHYIDVVLDRSLPNLERFLARHAVRPLEHHELVTLLKLLELQRQAMLMYTSCGWFFDDLSRIETVQILRYAGRAVQLAKEVSPPIASQQEILPGSPSAKGGWADFGQGIEPRFLQLLERAKSNVPAYGNGRRIYEQLVKPAMVDWERVGAKYAVSSLFGWYDQQGKINGYTVDLKDYQAFVAGRAKLAVGRAEFTSQVTRESTLLSFGALHHGDHSLNVAVREYLEGNAYQNMAQQTTEAFRRADFPEVIRALDRHFRGSSHPLSSLFPDEQRQVLDQMLASTLAETEAEYRQVYQRHYPLMRFLADIGHPIPITFRTAAELILNADLRKAVADCTLNVERFKSIVDEAKMWNIDLDTKGAAHLLQQMLEKMMAGFLAAPEDLPLLKTLVPAVSGARAMVFEVNLWEVQNLYYRTIKAAYRRFQEKARQGDETAEEWLTLFTSLGEFLSIRINQPS